MKAIKKLFNKFTWLVNLSTNGIEESIRENSEEWKLNAEEQQKRLTVDISMKYKITSQGISSLKGRTKQANFVEDLIKSKSVGFQVWRGGKKVRKSLWNRDTQEDCKSQGVRYRPKDLGEILVTFDRFLGARGAEKKFSEDRNYPAGEASEALASPAIAGTLNVRAESRMLANSQSACARGRLQKVSHPLVVYLQKRHNQLQTIEVNQEDDRLLGNNAGRKTEVHQTANARFSFEPVLVGERMGHRKLRDPLNVITCSAVPVKRPDFRAENCVEISPSLPPGRIPASKLKSYADSRNRKPGNLDENRGKDPVAVSSRDNDCKSR
ncbi:hypothetical protein WN55_10173 [Dufourea novaeangliae]|uniref:Uncharacterized protein n=1 Tax=Dufourea novaeangliae TaxID=178035 RepID=A0A154P4M1_DUFNO|nr:hypothetical protein WN55_10173 [Dufourea novaeangliae]